MSSVLRERPPPLHTDEHRHRVLGGCTVSPGGFVERPGLFINKERVKRGGSTGSVGGKESGRNRDGKEMGGGGCTVLDSN